MIKSVSASAPQAGAGWWRARLRRARRFLRSPRGYLTLALTVQLGLALCSPELHHRLALTLGAILAAVGTDLLMQRLAGRAPRFPASAMLTGLLVGMIIATREGVALACAAAATGIAGKYILRAARVHLFNPAALGLLAVYALFSAVDSWWGALPSVRGGGFVVVISGYLVCNRANKLPAALSFLFVYFAAFTGATLVTGTAQFAELFRPPLVNTALFCALFMISDPPTSPTRYGEQLVFGSLIAGFSFVIFLLTRAMYYPLAGLLLGNALFAAWRAVRASGRRRSPRTLDPQQLASGTARSEIAA